MTSEPQPQPQPQQVTPVDLSALDRLTQSVEGLAKESRKKTRFSYLKSAVLVGVTVAYLYAASSFLGGSDGLKEGENYVSVVKVQGLIADGKEASYATLAPALKAAFEDADSKGVVLQINSPGGTPVQSSLIHDLIVELKAKHKKRVIAVGEDMVTSGAYFIAVAADEIYVNRSTIAGSVGVISAGFGFPGLLEKLGVERRVITAGESKNMGDSFLPLSEADVASHVQLIGEIHEHFKDTVKDGRGDRLKLQTPGLFEGKVWTGGVAKDLGLVDGLGSIDSVALAQFNATQFKHFNKKKGMESLFSDLGVQSAKQVLSEISATSSPTPQAVY